MSRFLRLSFCLVLLGCGGPEPVSMSTAKAAENVQTSTQKITLKIGQPVTLTSSNFTLEFLEFKDSRCPTGTQCMWAGHATATLRIGRPGMAAETVVIGTEAPPAMQLPYQAVVGNVQFTLVSLEPFPTAKLAATKDTVRLTVQVNLL